MIFSLSLHLSPFYATISSMAKVNPAKFLQEVKVELGKVIWPSRQETIKLTFVVILVSSLVAAFIGGTDFILTKVMEVVIK